MLDTFTQQNAVIINTILAITGAILITICFATRKHTYKPTGCRPLGLSPRKSNLSDEYDANYSYGAPVTSTDEDGRPAWRVKALFTYPIKSCKGVELDVAEVVSTGFTFDRLFCFAEAELIYSAVTQDGKAAATNWVARTLRNRGFNKLALVRPEIWVPDKSVDGYTPELEEVRSQGLMVVYYPRVGRNALHSALIQAAIYLGLLSRETYFTVPLQPSSPSSQNPKSESNTPFVPVKIWKDKPLAYDYGVYIPPSFHRFVSPEKPSSKCLTLLRVSPTNTRQIYRNAPRKETLGFQPTTGFADAYPLHILSLSSVRDVNAHCAVDIPHLSIRRFRANVILQGPGKFEEDSWKVIRFSSSSPSSPSAAETETGNWWNNDENENEGLIVHTACRTIRCKLPNVDPDTGFRHPTQPDRSLKAYRRIDQGDLTNACLGMQGVPAVREGRIRVGDRIEVLERGEHRYIKMLAPGEVMEGV
ncbi:MOSC domain protein [Aspergillus undulatus]|uniref:MOSC domain protein n=1 Tax=Aspergillus undulatus TaxID=1810928 RepID=UPI003CCC939B